MIKLREIFKRAALRFPWLAWFGDHWLMVLTFYVIFMVTAGAYVVNRIRYAGVRDWPSVEATILGETGEVFHIQGQGRYGPTTTTIDTRRVQFEYWVDGRKYAGDRTSPDESGGYRHSPGKPGKAYYKPSHPEIAVLYPTEYSGHGLLFICLCSGILVGVNLYFTLEDLPPRRRA